jgi:hypothetical protein
MLRHELNDFVGDLRNWAPPFTRTTNLLQYNLLHLVLGQETVKQMLIPLQKSRDHFEQNSSALNCINLPDGQMGD